MKKGIVLLLLLSCLNATSCSCSCYRRSSKSEITTTNNDGPKTLDYNELKKIATKPYEDINLIMELRHYPNLYSKLLKDSKRSASLINKKIIGNKK